MFEEFEHNFNIDFKLGDSITCIDDTGQIPDMWYLKYGKKYIVIAPRKRNERKSEKLITVGDLNKKQIGTGRFHKKRFVRSENFEQYEVDYKIHKFNI
jgi:hypothetical protein